MHLGAWAAGARVSHLPEVVLHVAGQYVSLGNALKRSDVKGYESTAVYNL